MCGVEAHPARRAELEGEQPSGAAEAHAGRLEVNRHLVRVEGEGSGESEGEGEGAGEG